MCTKQTFRPFIFIAFFYGLVTTPFILKAQSGNATSDTGMVNASINQKGELEIRPSKTSSVKDFDFFEGSWNVSGRRLKTRLSHSGEWINYTAKLKFSKILKGIGNAEPYSTQLNGEDFEAFTLRIFNQKTRLWSIYYLDPNNLDPVNPVVGSFENNIGWFYCFDTFKGQKIIVVYKWDSTDPEKPSWAQAFSTDNGKTWEWNMHQHFVKAND